MSSWLRPAPVHWCIPWGTWSRGLGSAAATFELMGGVGRSLSSLSREENGATEELSCLGATPLNIHPGRPTGSLGQRLAQLEGPGAALAEGKIEITFYRRLPGGSNLGRLQGGVTGPKLGQN